ncbi:DUF3140 domain-containing protein [Mucilaginibacter gynuensis]|uniref:DUF3140 domain-containing protein n=1 Tax=Mucilaginibacter gynuensis TaxID=1302236 RepID=A0ABP8GLU0_9SPHI
MDKQEQEIIYQEFKQVVNMTATELEKWLKTAEAKSVGWDSGDGESIGHKSGEHITRILHKKKDELTAADYEHMRKVHGYVKSHLVQKPGHPKDSNWDYSLRNWGHDYTK